MSSFVNVPFPSTVLLVDDEAVVLKIVTKVLTARGLEVKAVSDGEQALELLSKGQFACLVTDKNLPGIDGMELIRQARQRQPHLACVVMTGYASTGSAVEALRAGASDYLEKPFADLDLIGRKIDLAIASHRTAHEREVFLSQLRSFEAELEHKERQVTTQRTEIDMFEQLLEVRVGQATHDLEAKCAILENTLRQSKDVDYALAVHTESILEYVASVQLADSDPIGVARGVLTRIRRRLTAHLSLIRQQVGEEGEGQGSR